MSGGLAIALLAAGSARRFGGGKLDANCGGRPLGSWALEAARQLEGRLAIITGAEPPAFAAGQELVVNTQAEEGLGTSAAAAARWAISTRADALIVLLADMPLVSPTTLRALANGSYPSAVRWAGDKPGAPACFPASMFADLAVLQGEDGASRLLRGRSDVRLVDVSDEELRDVDRPVDLADVAAILQAR